MSNHWALDAFWLDTVSPRLGSHHPHHGGCPVHYRMLSGTPGSYPLDVHNTSQPKVPPDTAEVPGPGEEGANLPWVDEKRKC